jgi:hypothetical protein
VNLSVVETRRTSFRRCSSGLQSFEFMRIYAEVEMRSRALGREKYVVRQKVALF